MKNQYFGDVKDLFKYDLVQWLIECLPAVDSFTFITMLTLNDGRSDGNKLNYQGRAGCKNEELVCYLAERVSSGRRNISEIREYYNIRDIDIEIYGENDFFSHSTRDSYFAGIRDELLSGSLIVCDPDNGMEVKHPNEKHMLWLEVTGLFDRMGDDSVLILFQHFRREKHEMTVAKIALGIELATRQKPIYLYDHEIVFFLLAKQPETLLLLENAVWEYSNKYPILRCSSREGPLASELTSGVLGTRTSNALEHLKKAGDR